MKKFLFLISLMTAFLFIQADEIPRPEYPRPQFERSDWINLNGEWTYTFDFGKSGVQRNLMNSKGFEETIIVPFCPESILSGVGHTDFIEMMWYHKQINIPENWEGKDIMLHFGGVDFESEVFINGESVGIHWGGTSSFAYNISPYVTDGEPCHLVVRVKDVTRSGKQSGGKQCWDFNSRGCSYTRTTGIWQTVWLEAVSKNGLNSCKITPDLDNNCFILRPVFRSLDKGLKLQATLLENGKKVARDVVLASNSTFIELNVKNPKTWSPANPFLYDILLEVINSEGKLIDSVSTYAGMRKIHWEGNKLFLNNEPLYLRLVLDQGFYPDGIWTAPSDEALLNDIKISMQAGFNGARLHQKVFEERFHYWADKLGYLTWGESSSWGLDVNDEAAARNFISEWEEIVERDLNHPSIIAWTPFNETWGRSADGRQHNRLLIDIYDLTHNLDPTRPVNETSGNYHIKTDLWTVHSYEQDPEKFLNLLKQKEDGSVHTFKPEWEADYTGQPYLIDEYGGIKWVPAAHPGGEAPNWSNGGETQAWGYGKDPESLEEFYARLEALTDAILSMDHVCGYCYTQLTDVEQEQNGIYLFNRDAKFDMKRIHAIFSKTPSVYK